MTTESVEQSAVHRPPTIEGIPERFRSKQLIEFDPDVSAAALASLSAASTMLAPGGQASLVLSGPPGAGKTHLAAGICNAVWTRDWLAYQAELERTDYIQVRPDGNGGYDLERHPMPATMPRWANVPSLINRLRGGDDDVRAEARSLGRYPGLVVLDDLGREKVTEWTGETIYVLVNERYERLLATIVTTNLSVRELTENGYGPAISRLAESGRLVEMASAIDYRARR